jgi:hypothetical protein
VTHSYLAELPRLEDVEPATYTEVLVADGRLDQGRIRAAVDAVFEAHPALGAVFQLCCNTWTSCLGGGWAWGIEPPGAAVTDVIARQRASFDMHTGRLFAASLIPGVPDRVVLTASHLCMDGPSWQAVVEHLMQQYTDGALSPSD